MTTDEIRNFANALGAQTNASAAYFTVIDDDYDHPSIRATKEGLRLMAAEFLHASVIEWESGIWDVQAKWLVSADFELSFIDVIANKTGTVVSKKDPSRLTQRLVEIGCGLAAILALGLLVIGAISVIRTLISWL